MQEKTISAVQYARVVAAVSAAQKANRELEALHDRIRELLNAERDIEDGHTFDAIYLDHADVTKAVDWLLLCLGIKVSR